MNYRSTTIAAVQVVGLFISVIGMPFTPVPIILSYVRNSRLEGLSALALSIAVIAVFAGWHVAILLFGFGLMAVGTAEGMRKQWRPESAALWRTSTHRRIRPYNVLLLLARW